MLSIYLDSVFFPNLHPLDFAQEGHHLAFSQPQDPKSDLMYKGVVYNEMKGAMSSETNQLWQHLTRALYPDTTYHHNSGGEPSTIPDLTHKELLDFHREHYHPSNATFLTFGNIPATQIQAELESAALSQFEKNDRTIEVSRETRFSEARYIDAEYPVDSKDHSNKTHIVFGWLLGENSNLKTVLEAQFLSSLLLDNSASPLRAALEQTTLARSPSPLCGLEDSNREMCFVCGVEGSDLDKAEAVEALILDVLKNISKKGVPKEHATAVLHQIEFEQREIGGHSYPYGLQLILQILPSCIHRGQPLSVLDIDPIPNRIT